MTLRNWFWQMLRLLGIAMLAMSVAACDELNSDEDDDDDDQETLMEGRFVDSPVAGLGYRVAGEDRLTDADGTFEYREDRDVRFFHGNTSLGRAPGQPFVTPNDLDICDDATEITQQECIINIVRFLLTHKDDGASNIQLDEEARDDASILSPVNFDVDPDVFGTVNDTENPGLQSYLAMNAGEGRSGLASVSEAETHLDCSEQDIDAGHEPDGDCSTPASSDGDGAGGDGDTGGDGDSGGDVAMSLCLPGDPTGMLCAEQLCAVPEVGPAIVEAAGGGCGDAGGGTASPIDPALLCAIPEIGPAIAEGLGGSCEGGGDGGSGGSLCLPGDPTGLLCAEQLCVIPELGPVLVEGAGGSCGDGGGDMASPIDPAQLCAIPEIGPAIAEGLGGSC